MSCRNKCECLDATPFLPLEIDVLQDRQSSADELSSCSDSCPALLLTHASGTESTETRLLQCECVASVSAASGGFRDRDAGRLRFVSRREHWAAGERTGTSG